MVWFGGGLGLEGEGEVDWACALVPGVVSSCGTASGRISGGAGGRSVFDPGFCASETAEVMIVYLADFAEADCLDGG